MPIAIALSLLNSTSSTQASLTNITMVRQYVQNPNRDQTGKKQRLRTQTSTEWDMSINLKKGEEDASIAILLAYVTAQYNKEGTIIKYLLVSGVEYTEQVKKDRPSTTTGNPHVHMCMVVSQPINKAQAFSLLRPIKFGVKEYAKIRDSKNFTYFGWRVHHRKIDTKVDPTKRHLLELGTLPKDVWTPLLIKKCNYVVNKYGCPQDKKDWIVYKSNATDGETLEETLEREAFEDLEAARQSMETCRMRLEDIWTTEQCRKYDEENDAVSEAAKQCKLMFKEQGSVSIKRAKARKAFFINKHRKLNGRK